MENESPWLVDSPYSRSTNRILHPRLQPRESSGDGEWSDAQNGASFFSAVRQLLLAADGRERLSHKRSSSFARVPALWCQSAGDRGTRAQLDGSQRTG
jgi:hypothetical protein